MPELLSTNAFIGKYVLLDFKNIYKIICENEQIKSLCLELLASKCPILPCTAKLLRREDFPLHIEKKHGKFTCHLCFENQKLFFEEITLFDSPSSLRSHILTSEEKKKSANKKSFGHPECKFCRTRFYSNDELYAHCRDAHESCFLCNSAGVKDQYYENYLSLVIIILFNLLNRRNILKTLISFAMWQIVLKRNLLSLQQQLT